MDATLITAVALALALLLVVLVILQLNRRAVRYRENELFPGMAGAGRTAAFFESEGPSAAATAPPPPEETYQTGETKEPVPGTEDRDVEDSLDLEKSLDLDDSLRSMAQDHGGVSRDDTRSSEGPSPFRPLPVSPSGNPAAALVAKLMEGQGELSDEELRRLELYRPEKILQAVDEQEGELQGKNQERRRARLGKIRAHAKLLVSEEEETGAIDETGTTDAARAMEASGAADESGGTDGWAEAQSHDEEAAAEAEQPEVLGRTPEDLVVEYGISIEEPVEEPVEEPGERSGPAEVEQTEGYAAPEPEPEPELKSQDEDENESEYLGEWEGWEEYEPVEEEDFDIDALSVPLEEPAPAHQEPTEERAVEDTDVGAVESGLASIDIQVTTAEDVLGLPAKERIDALSFLEPPELSRTFLSAEDPELKRAVVDTLEQDGSQAALTALAACLEDTDPEMQLYALEASERLLSGFE